MNPIEPAKEPKKYKKHPRRKRPLVLKFNAIHDPRSKQGQRHPQASVLAVVYTAMVSGTRGYLAMAQWAAALPQQALKRLGCRRSKDGKYIPPSMSTIRRVLQALDPIELNELMTKVLNAKKSVAVVAVDGKTLRGTRRIHKKAKAVLTAVDANTGMVLAQREISAEHMEIPEFIPLLTPLLLEDTVVTADALHTQVAHAKFLVEEKKADFLFVVKNNQETLYNDLCLWPEEEFMEPVTTLEKGHGRIEERTLWAASVTVDYLKFPYIQQIIRIHRKVSTLGGQEIREEVSFAITSLPQEKAAPERLLALTRGHWTIENQVNYVLDESFGEDRSQVREGAVVLSCLRAHVLSLFRSMGFANIQEAIRSYSWNWRKAFALVGA